MKAKKVRWTLDEVLDLKVYGKGETPRSVEVEIAEEPTCIEIKPQGYGDYASAKGKGVPIILEVTDSKLRLVVWADINADEPTHIIDLEGAREEARKER